MGITLKTFIKAKFAEDTDTVEYTCPAATQARIEAFSVCNTNGSDQQLWVNIIPSGSGLGDSNELVKNLNIAASESLNIDILKNHVLEAGDKISVVASLAGAISILASGRVVT